MKKILVIEDDAHFRENLLRFLKLENFHGLEAEDGLVGVQVAQIEQPDLILCDAELPELDGYSVLTAIRHDPATKQIRFVLLSDDSENCNLAWPVHIRPDACLPKPVQLRQLSREISAQLSLNALAS